MNKTKYKTLNKLGRDPRIIEIWSEEGTDDGLWASLSDGNNWEGCSCLHEYTVKDLLHAALFIETGNSR